MKKIIVLFALLLGSIISIAQPVTQRGTSAVTVQDSRLFAEFNFRPPAFPDTIRANQQIGLDSCGALIFSRDINAYYYRACSPKRWVRVASGGSTSDSAYLSYRPLTDSTFLLCRVGGTRCDTIKVNGKGVTQAWLLGGNLNPVSNNLGTISTADVVIITNDVARMKIAGNGINRSSAARNRYLMIDTLTRYLFYGDESDTTAWKLLGNSNAIAGTSFLGTTNNIPLEFRVKNIKSGIIDSNYRNTALGYASQRFSQATVGTDSALYNTSMGFRALGANIYGDQNTSIGYAANALGTNLKGNTAIGYGAGAQNRTSSFDVAVGWGALPRNYYGYANTAVGADIANIAAPGVGDTMTYNTMLGYGSAYYKYTGRNNVFVGDSTGANNTTGSRNVFIGSKAGKNETGSDKLYISNSSISNPLIKGNFADSTLNVNGKMSISLTSQTPDSSLDVTGGVKLRTIYRSSALTDSMLLVGADGGVVKREVIVPSNTNVTRIISGSAVWDSLLIYSVTKCFYYINGILYNSAATNVTLATADSSNPRIDVIYCDTLGNVGVITGIPSPDPVKPTVNPLSQIELTHINVNAQGTTPAGVSQRIIYNENVGVPNEWNTSTDVPASGVDFAYTVNPYVGVKSAFAPAYNSNYSLIFTNNLFVNADTLSELSMYLRQNSAPPAARAGTTMFSIILLKSGVQITKPVLVSDGLYGYSVLTLNSYQHLAVPFSDFLFKNALDKTFDQIQIAIEFLFVPKLGYQFDYITAGAGGTPPAVTSDYWTLSGNDNTSFPNAKLGTTSKDQLSIVTDDIERINITNAGVISIPQLQTTTDTLLYKPLVINPTNGQVANIGNWGNNIVYTENPIMSRTSGDSNIIYFNADTANVWRGGGSGTIPTLQQVLDNNHNLVSEINLQGTLSGDGSTLTSNVNAFGGNAAGQVYNGVTDMNAFGNYAGYLYGADDGAPHSNINLFGNNAGEEAFGNNVNGLGFYSTQLNYGNDVNAMGYNSAQGNQGSNVNAFGNGAGLGNPYSDVNLFGQAATATAGNQIVFTGSSGAIQSRIQQPSTTQTYTLPDATGTLPLSVNGYTANSAGAITIPIGGSGTVTDISQGYGITASPINPITVSGTIEVDTVTLSGKYLRINDTTNMLSPYTKTSALNLKLNIADTSSMLTPYLRKVDTASLSSRIDLRVKYSDTSSMLSPYLRKVDTANKWVNSISRTLGKDSIIFFIGSTRYAIKDSTGGQNLQQVTDINDSTTNPIILYESAVNKKKYINIQSNGMSANNDDSLKSSFFNAFEVGSSYYNSSPYFVYITELLYNALHYEYDYIKTFPAPAVVKKITNLYSILRDNTHDFYLNPPDSIINTIDTLATLRDVRTGGGGGGGGTGTVTSIAQGYGITNSPNPIVATGTITVDTATLSGKYLRTTDGVPYTGATADVDLGIHILSAQGLRVTGTNGAGDIHLRHQATDATATGQSTSLFADANGDLKYKNAGNFYTTLKTSGNAANAVYTFPSATTTLIGAADTSVFQRKSISANTMMANNTNAAANTTAQAYYDVSGTYSGTITWTGTAPTTQTINAYQWQQIGKMVHLQIFGYYTNAGTACSAVSLTIPSDCPAPDISMFTSGALAILYQGIGGLGLSNTSLTTTTNAYMRRNASNNGNELLISAASANYRRYQIDITYRAQ